METKKMYQPIRDLSHQMRLFGFHSSTERRCQESLAEDLHPSELVRLLLEDELLYRKQTLAKRLATKAKFRNNCLIEEWDSTINRGITKAKLKELALLNFYHKTQNLILIGKTGVGKTQLAISLGNQLCRENISTGFYSTNLLFEEASAEKAGGRYLNLIKKLKKMKTIVLDDFALRTYNHDEANMLLEIIEERYRKGITIITSQVSPEGWKSLFEDPVIGEAITDRLLNPSEKIELIGDSYRKKLGE
jgi:DNA replication protein DnaC